MLQKLPVRSGVHVHATINFPGDGTANAIDNTQYKSAFALNLASGCKCIEGFTRLTDYNI